LPEIRNIVKEEVLNQIAILDAKIEEKAIFRGENLIFKK
jgi:hypothetical protein